MCWWVRLLSPKHVRAIHVSIGRNFDLETTFGFKLLHYFYRVFHQWALLHLILLNFYAVVHDLARFCGNALSLSPRWLNLPVQLFFVFLNVLFANKSIIIFFNFFVISRFDLVSACILAVCSLFTLRCQTCHKIKVSWSEETAQVFHVLCLDIIVNHTCSFGHFILQVLTRCLQTFLFHSTDGSRRIFSFFRFSWC